MMWQVFPPHHSIVLSVFTLEYYKVAVSNYLITGFYLAQLLQSDL